MTLKLPARILLSLFFFAFAGALSAKEKLPETTKDGLVLKHHTKLGAVYIKPGATLSAYDKVKVLECYVAFKKNWRRNYNDEQPGLEGRVTTADMKKIKQEVAEGFNESFTRELDKAGYTVVDTTGPDVLLIRPAIINLTVTAPDVPTPGIQATIVSSSGSMTLYAELYDSETSAKIAEVLDAEEVGQNSFNHLANSVSNRFEFDQTIDAWAEILVERLDEAHGKTRK